MKRALLIFLFVWIGGTAGLFAATRAEINILEAAENIRFLSQEITKNYLYLYANPRRTAIKNRLNRNLDRMVENIRTISTTTSDEDTKNILEFLTYSKDQIEQLIKKRPDKESAALMLDYSESLLEGANSISAAHAYEFSEREKMLMKSKAILFQLERSTKYYIALYIGLGTSINIEQMNQSTKKLQELLETVYKFPYPDAIEEKKSRLRDIWSVVESIISKRQKFFIVEVVNLASNELKNQMEPFIIYHRKNQ